MLVRDLQALRVCQKPRPGLDPSRSTAPDQRGPLQLPKPPATAHTPPAVPVTTGPPELDAVWREVLVHPTVAVILGGRGTGKTGLGFRLLELLRYVAPAYIVGLPETGRDLLPDWIGIAPTLDWVPCNAVALVDEAQLRFHARASMLAVTKAISAVLSLSRQRAQTWIFVTHEARLIDRTIVSAADALIFKEPGILQGAFERPELRRLVAQVTAAFGTLSGDRRGSSYVYAPQWDVLGLLPNALPSFWTARLSRAFAAALPPARARFARHLTVQEKAQEAQALRAKGRSYREIAQTLGVTIGTVHNYLKGYSYRRSE